VIADILNQDQVEIQQILVEFHDFFPEISRRKTKKAIRLLNKAGYQIFHVSQNGHEYSFLKRKGNNTTNIRRYICTTFI